jgi:type II secretory pathway component PulC
MAFRRPLSLGLCLVGAWAAAAGTPPAVADEAPIAASEVRCDAAGCTLGPCVVNNLFTNPSPILSSARVVPEVVAGQTRGFRLFGIRAGSLASQLGAQNGDLLTDVDGRPLDTPAAALTLGATLQTATRVEVGLERAGKRLVRVVQLDRRPVTAGECPPSPIPQPAAGAAPTSAPPSPSAAQLRRDLARDITCKKSHCTLHKQAIERLLSDPAALAGQARVVPVMHDGQVDGLALVSVHPDSIFARLGLRNHDVLTRVGGYEIYNPEKALAAYAALRDAREIDVELKRAGKPLTLHYSLEP